MRLAQLGLPRSATLVERGLAYVLDSIATLALWVIVLLAISSGSFARLEEDRSLQLVGGMLFLVVPFVYLVLAEGLTGTTIGKHILGLRVIGPTGERPGLFAATVRNVLRLAWALGPLGPAFLALDAALVQLSERDQRMGDAAAGTRVVRARPRGG